MMTTATTRDGYRIQRMLPVHIGWFDATCEAAEFTIYEGKQAVKASVRMGLTKEPYTIYLTHRQAHEADIIERI
jgi:hypothetical protein